MVRIFYSSGIISVCVCVCAHKTKFLNHIFRNDNRKYSKAIVLSINKHCLIYLTGIRIRPVEIASGVI